MPISARPLATAEQCKAEIAQLRNYASTTPGVRSAEYDGPQSFPNGERINMHRAYVCKGHQTWTDVQ